MVNWWRNRRAKQLLEQAMAAAQNGKYEEAAHMASAALVLQPDSAEVLQQRAMWRQLAHMDEDALADYDKAIELSPDVASLYLERANLKRENGDYDAALTDLNKAIELDTNSVEAYHARARLYIVTDELDAAIKDLTAAIGQAPRADYFRQRAELYLLTNDSRRALSDLEQAVPSLHKAYQQAATAIKQQDDNARNQELLGVVRDAYLTALTTRASLYQQTNELPQALNDLQMVLAIDDNFAAAYNVRGKISQSQGDAGAQHDFLKAIELDPKQAAYYLNLADLYFLAGAHSQAKNVFEQLKREVPDNPIAAMGLILCDYALGRRRDAQQQWQALAADDKRLLDKDQLKRLLNTHPRLLQTAIALTERLG